jgi:Cft2 family RNA processing exonuclease
MTEPTREISRLSLNDFRALHVQRFREDPREYYTEDEISGSLGRARLISVGKDAGVVVDGLEITAWYAGHALGAVMFHVKCLRSGQSVLYTGDYDMACDPHLGSAQLPDDCMRPDVLITEATFAMAYHRSRLLRNRDFVRTVFSHVSGSTGKRVGGGNRPPGRVLIPCSAVGAVQPMSFVLEQFWRRVGCKVPIYASLLSTLKMYNLHKVFADWSRAASVGGGGGIPRQEHITPDDKDQDLHDKSLLCDKERNDLHERAADVFTLRHLRPFYGSSSRSRNHMDSTRAGKVVINNDPWAEPQVLFSGPKSLENGTSLNALRRWGGDPTTLVLIPGYCRAGTVADQLAGPLGKRLNEVNAKIEVPPHGFLSPVNLGNGQDRPSELGTEGVAERKMSANIDDGAFVHLPSVQLEIDEGILSLRCRVQKLEGWTNHVDSEGIMRVIRQCKPKHVVLVHGSGQNMRRLGGHIYQQLGNGVECHFPANFEPLLLAVEEMEVASLSRPRPRLPVPRRSGTIHMARHKCSSEE